MNRIKKLRWQQRSLPEDIKQNLSQAEIEVRHSRVCLHKTQFFERKQVSVGVSMEGCLVKRAQ
jgi:hypothetical protein